jgi:hypothetical protein
VLALAAAGLRALAEPEQDRAAAAEVAGQIDAVSARRAAVEADLEALAALRRERRRRAIDHSLLGRRIGNRARARLDGYRRAYEREIGELTTPKAVAVYAETLPESIERTFAAAWREIAADTERAVAQALPAYLREMGVDPTELDEVALAAPIRGPGALHAEGSGGKFDLVGEGMPAMMMAGSLGLLSSHLFGLLAVSGAAAVLGPLAIGGALAGTLLAHRRRVAEATRNRVALTKALGDAFTVAAGEMVLAVEQATAAWRAGAEQAVDAAFAARQTELDARRRELAALAAQDAAERKKAAAAAGERLERITTAQRRAAELAAALRTTG